ncbi:hypothetical protein [Rhizobium rhizosphaerae]|uniref:hypothetical protein n=1 Tax=Xaviernesmea rhizosphaerae TaxID=1672749 RepID=UPI00111B0128|nr:hypothetical protein [Xaviernesmea rhizosphaerae]
MMISFETLWILAHEALCVKYSRAVRRRALDCSIGRIGAKPVILPKKAAFAKKAGRTLRAHGSYFRIFLSTWMDTAHQRHNLTGHSPCLNKIELAKSAIHRRKLFSKIHRMLYKVLSDRLLPPAGNDTNKASSSAFIKELMFD